MLADAKSLNDVSVAVGIGLHERPQRDLESGSLESVQGQDSHPGHQFVGEADDQLPDPVLCEAFSTTDRSGWCPSLSGSGLTAGPVGRRRCA